MAGSAISGGNAKKYSNYARMGGVVLLVAATGLWALNIPGMGPEDLPQKPAPAPAPTEQPKQAASQQNRIEAEQITDAADRFEIAWAKAPKQAEPTKIIDDPEPPPSGPEWSYLGPIKEADRCLAMVSVEGSQRILAVGRTLGDSKLVAVDDEKIVVETKGARRDVHKSMRSGPTVAWLRSMPANTPMGNATTAAGQAGMSPEVLQRLRERGIDPAQAQRFREQMQNGGGGGGRNRGQPGNNNNGGRGPGGGNAAASFGVNGMGAQGAQTGQPFRAQQRGADSDAARAETAN